MVIHLNKINNLNEINNNSVKYYKYKTIDFFFNNKKSDYLIVYLHGAIYINEKTNKPIKKPIFYHSNYNYCDTLCLSDKLLEDYNDKNLLLSWYLSTPTHNYFNIYCEILTYILKNNYKKVLFTGGSGGAYPALLFSSYFNCNCLIFNPQIYLHKYHYFEKMLNILDIDEIECDIENFITKHGPPNKITLVTNTRDVHHYEGHSLIFESFISKDYPDNIITNYFKGTDPSKGKSHHRVCIPSNTNYYILVKNALLQ
jgi:hypothetical protein